MLKLSVGKGGQVTKQLCCRVWRWQSITYAKVAIEHILEHVVCALQSSSYRYSLPFLIHSWYTGDIPFC